MHHVQLDPVHMMELAVERDALHVQQAAYNFHRFTHGEQGLPSLDAHIFCKRIPPGADPADDAVRGQVIEGEQGGSQQTNITGPVVDHA